MYRNVEASCRRVTVALSQNYTGRNKENPKNSVILFRGRYSIRVSAVFKFEALPLINLLSFETGKYFVIPSRQLEFINPCS